MKQILHYALFLVLFIGMSSCDKSDSSLVPTIPGAFEIVVINERSQVVAGATVNFYGTYNDFAQETNVLYSATSDNTGRVYVTGANYTNTNLPLGCYVDAEFGTRSNWESNTIYIPNTKTDGSTKVFVIVNENRTFFLSKANGGLALKNGKKWTTTSFKLNGTELVGTNAPVNVTCFLDDVYYLSKPDIQNGKLSFFEEGAIACSTTQVPSNNTWTQSGNSLTLPKLGAVTINSLNSTTLVIQYQTANSSQIIQTLISN